MPLFRKISHTLFFLSLISPFCHGEPQLITLEPTTGEGEAHHNKHIERQQTVIDKENSDLYYSGDLICNSVSCYPKVFEPLADWQEIKPLQQVPKGLDIRINMDTGRKETKIIEKNIPDPKMVDISHEFVDDFRDLNEAMKQNEENKIIQILDKLDEYAHDYKHGSKIIKYEQDVLSELMLSKVYGDKVKEISARVLSGCLRNNPPAIQIYNPRYVDELVNSLIFEKNPIVLKRYLGVLQTVADKASNSSNLFTNLLKVYKGDIDNQIKLRVLEILSDLELSDARGKGLVKRSVNGKDDKNEPTLQQWFNEFSTNIQNSQLDEYHLKRFFHTLVNIKKEGGSNVKVSKDFLNWLSKQTEERKEALNDDLAKRDLEQYEFNKKLIESRHLLFGNPLADRIKNFNDEF